MKQVHKFWFPDYEEHFPRMLDKSLRNTGILRYQWEAREFAISQCKNKRICIDIGANVGLWSCELVNYFDQVVIFEPVLEFIECLKKNVTKNNYLINQVALGREESLIEMIIDRSNSGHSHIDTLSIGKGTIPLKRLDSFNYKNVDLIKIDVEGFEEEILFGAETTIKENKPVLVVEQRDHEYKKAMLSLPSIKILESWGYVPVQKFSKDWVLKYKDVL